MQSKSSKDLVTPGNRACFVESTLALIVDEILVPSFEDPATEFLSAVSVEGNFSFSFQAGVPQNFFYMRMALRRYFMKVTKYYFILA